MSLSPKKLILLGLGVILLIAIPLTVFVVQKQQQTRSGAAPATNLSFVDTTTKNPTTETTPKTVSIGETVSFDVVMDPGINVVGGLTLIINYDSTKLAIEGQGITPNTTVMGNLLGDINNTPGQINVSFSPAAIDPTKAITQKTTIGTITLKALAITDVGTPTKITFDGNTIVVPIGSGDTNSNVLAGSSPAFVVIVAQGEVTPTPTATPVPGVTTQPTATPTSAPVPQATATPIPVPTATPIPPVAANQIPVCSGLAIDVPTTGTLPYTVNFTATGTDSDGTISLASFNFGEGAVVDVTSGGGIGTNSVNIPASHIYSSAGTFTASAVLTDDASGASAACSQTIIVSAGTSGGAAPTVPPVAVQPTATPTLAATGPAETILGIGILGILFTIIGAAILFIL
ncbi:MAG: cohesin domain-containing protein [Patescibacteria group bacterium]